MSIRARGKRPAYRLYRRWKQDEKGPFANRHSRAWRFVRRFVSIRAAIHGRETLLAPSFEAFILGPGDSEKDLPA